MISFPFTSQDGDRKIKAVEFRAIFRKYFTNGVFMNPSTEFQIVEVGGMKVTAKAGYANINGVIAYEETDTELTIETAESKDRIDRIVLRLNDNTEARNVSLLVIKGTASDSPTAPELTRNESVYDLGLATIYVNGSTTNITQSKITDTRLDTTVCGVVSGTVKEADTETLYAQIQSDLAEFKTNEQAEFIEWFNSIKDKLGEDLAGNLQLQIDDINDTKTSLTDANNNPIVTAPMIPPMNLLINGDFQFWQRGENFTIEGDEAFHYTADMWCVYASTGQTITVNRTTDGLQFSGASAIMQRMNPLEVGKNYIFLCEVDGDVKTLPIVGGTYIENDFLRYNKSGSYEQFQIKSNGITNIANARLWEGDTVYKIVEEDDAIALLRCQDWVIWGEIPSNAPSNMNLTTGVIEARVPFPKKMKSIPTVKVYDLQNNEDRITRVNIGKGSANNSVVSGIVPRNTGFIVTSSGTYSANALSGYYLATREPF